MTDLPSVRPPASPHKPQVELKRSLSLPLVVLYGLGVTIGAGIYVLIGATAERAGAHAPMAFVLAAVIMAFSAASYAEISGRFPVSAGAAAYVRAGFRWNWLSTAVGLLVIASGVVSSAAITVGAAGYFREFIDVPPEILVPIMVVIVTAIAAWGIMESVLLAGLFTVLETGVLLVIIFSGIAGDPAMLADLPEIVPALSDSTAWLGLGAAGLLAFFAYIGFEDIVNLAEEVKRPKRTLPWAIFLTLIIGTFVYILVTYVALHVVPVPELAASTAPLSLVFDRVTGLPPATVTVIAITATLNGVIIQMIMASRVLYGLARQGSAPRIFGRVNARTRTPIIATGTVATIVLILAVAFPLEGLAEWTSLIVLLVFSLVNASLLLLKWRGEAAPEGVVRVPIWVPACGVLTCLGLIAAGFLG